MPHDLQNQLTKLLIYMLNILKNEYINLLWLMEIYIIKLKLKYNTVKNEMIQSL